MKTIVCWLVFALGLLGTSSTAAAATTRLEIDSPHFTLISSDNEGRTRDIAWQFEQIRSVVATLWPWARVDSDRPVMILVVPDEDGMKHLSPYYWEQGGRIHPSSVFVEAPDRYYIALRSDLRAGDQEGINPDASRATIARTESLLERSVALNGAFSPAQWRLSEVKTDLGKADESIDFGRRAVALAPEAFNTHYALGRALGTASRFADALREARCAATLAANEQQKQAAASLVTWTTTTAIAHLPPLQPALPPPAAVVHVGGPIKAPVKTKDAGAIYPDVAAAAAVPLIATVTVNFVLQ